MIDGQPLVVCYGMGRDSTAILVGLWQRSLRPDLIIFADVGAERQATYAYLCIINEWLESVNFPQVTVVRYEPDDFKHWPHYHSIEENCLTNVTLPAIAYGGHSCSKKWKISPMIKFLKTWQPAVEALAAGKRVIKAVGFEDSAHEHKRAERCSTFAVQDEDPEEIQLWFPLQEWHWNLAHCIQEIETAGLIVPPKSSCYFCTAMKPWEVDSLEEDKLCRIVILEARTAKQHIDYVIAKRVELTRVVAGELPIPRPRQRSKPTPTMAEIQKKLASLPPDGTPITAGLWRKPVKGMRGAIPKPGSMTQYIREKGLLPAAQIDALIRLTPTDFFKQEDFERQGITGWQDWIARIIEQSKLSITKVA